jgi:type IV pilus assembly protein PilV
MRLAPRAATARRGRMGGTTLVEVLVSVLLLSFGLAGMLGAQGASVVYQRTSSVQMDATQLAIALGDVARANPVGFKSSSYAWTQAYLSEALPAPEDCGLASTCTPQGVANADLRNWLIEVRRVLPQGDAFVRNSADGSALEVWLMWQNAKGVASVKTESTCATEAIAAATVKPHCVFLRIKT